MPVWSRIRRSGTSPFFQSSPVGGGGAAVIAGLRLRQMEGQNRPVHPREGYGLSVTVLTFNPMYLTEFSGTTGLPLPPTSSCWTMRAARSRSARRRNLRQGTTGGDARRSDKPEANAAGVFHRDGYFRTGDVGVFDDKGFLKIVDQVEGHDPRLRLQCHPNEVEAVASPAPAACWNAPASGAPDEKIRRGSNNSPRQDAKRNADSRGIARWRIAAGARNDRLQDAENHPVHSTRRRNPMSAGVTPSPRVAQPEGCGRTMPPG